MPSRMRGLAAAVLVAATPGDAAATALAEARAGCDALMRALERGIPHREIAALVPLYAPDVTWVDADGALLLQGRTGTEKAFRGLYDAMNVSAVTVQTTRRRWADHARPRCHGSPARVDDLS